VKIVLMSLEFERGYVNPLMATCGVRWLPLCEYWIMKVDFLDKLLVKYFPHEVALKIVQDFFLESPQNYTHLLIYAEDVITTPDCIKLLIEDAVKYGFDVVSAWFNYDFKMNWVSLTKKDLSDLNITSPHQYEFMNPLDMLNFEDPFMEVFFQGMGLTLIKRSVLEKVKLYKPYKYIEDEVLGRRMTRGIMFDVSFALQLKELGIKQYVDRRAFCIHFGRTIEFIRRNETPRIEFIPKTRKLEIRV